MHQGCQSAEPWIRKGIAILLKRFLCLLKTFQSEMQARGACCSLMPTYLLLLSVSLCHCNMEGRVISAHGLRGSSHRGREGMAQKFEVVGQEARKDEGWHSAHFLLLFSPGPQSTGWCHLHIGRVFLLDHSTSAQVVNQNYPPHYVCMAIWE